MAAFGGWLIKTGVVNEETAQEIVASGADFLSGLLVVGVTVAWSWWSKRQNKGTVNEKSETSEKGQAGKTGEVSESGETGKTGA
jgi:hypothetical protein